AAHHPLSHAMATVSDGRIGDTSAPTSASESSGSITGAASALAGTVSNGIAWNCSHSTGAVASPHAADTAITSDDPRGSGYPSSARWSRGTRRKIDDTAANDS